MVKLLGMVENVGENTLLSQLEQATAKANEVDFAAAFVTAKGLSEVMPLLRRIAKSGRVRLLTGVMDYITEPEALRMLLDEQERWGGGFLARVSRNSHFHWKTYYIFAPSTITVTVGSSNLTVDGLTKSGECDLVVSAPRIGQAARILHAPFEQEWDKSSRLDEGVVKRYKAFRASTGGPPRRKRPPIAKILGAVAPDRANAPEPRYWRDWVDARLSRGTQRIIRQRTDWDEKGYAYMQQRGPLLKRGDRLILFDFYGCRVDFVEIRETTRKPLPTPEGNHHFAAYESLNGKRSRSMDAGLWHRLRAAGLLSTKASARITREISRPRWNRLFEVIQAR